VSGPEWPGHEEVRDMRGSAERIKEHHGLRHDVATDKVRKASRALAPDSPSPGEGREAGVAWQTKKTPRRSALEPYELIA
jgi:hypothetical protein